MADERPRPPIDFADELAGREAEREAARRDGWKLVLFLAAVGAIVGALFGLHLVTAGLEPAAKREDRLTPTPLPKAFCTAPGAAAELG